MEVGTPAKISDNFPKTHWSAHRYAEKRVISKTGEGLASGSLIAGHH